MGDIFSLATLCHSCRKKEAGIFGVVAKAANYNADEVAAKSRGVATQMK